MTARHTRRKPAARRRRSFRWQLWLSLCAAAGFLFLLAVGSIARRLATYGNTDQTRFDAIIVLGSPADGDGNPRPAQLSRVTEAVHEYERGVAHRLILTGAAVANRFVEAQVMARTAEAQGIPASALYLEPNARDTIHNACYAVRIMKQHGWQSAEVIDTPSQSPRAGLIFSKTPIAWRIHPAPPLGPVSGATHAWNWTLETLKTARYELWARHTESCVP